MHRDCLCLTWPFRLFCRLWEGRRGGENERHKGQNNPQYHCHLPRLKFRTSERRSEAGTCLSVELDDRPGKTIGKSFHFRVSISGSLLLYRRSRGGPEHSNKRALAAPGPITYPAHKRQRNPKQWRSDLVRQVNEKSDVPCPNIEMPWDQRRASVSRSKERQNQSARPVPRPRRLECFDHDARPRAFQMQRPPANRSVK